jgi:hypothetical protein
LLVNRWRPAVTGAAEDRLREFVRVRGNRTTDVKIAFYSFPVYLKNGIGLLNIGHRASILPVFSPAIFRPGFPSPGIRYGGRPRGLTSALLEKKF